jgi:hypothetical protein
MYPRLGFNIAGCTPVVLKIVVLERRQAKW